MQTPVRIKGERWLTLLASPGENGDATDPYADADDVNDDVDTEGLSGASRGCYNRAAPISPEVRMRPYRLVDEALDEEEDAYPHVVPIGAGGRSRATPFGLDSRPRPWTPRETVVPVATPRGSASPLTAPQGGFSRTHRLMIASFVIICVGMMLGMGLVRVWDEASRAVAALPPEGSLNAPRASNAPPVQAAPPLAAQESPSEGGGITTEVRVLQPNYTVAPGDTLGSIARRHGTSLDALASINNLENRNSLGVGQKLIIP